MLQSTILYVELIRRLANLSKSDQHREHVVAVQLAHLRLLSLNAFLSLGTKPALD